MVFVEDDEVVETLAAKRPDDSFRNSVRTRRVNGRGDRVDADPSGALAEVATIDRIAIALQMPWLVAPGCCLDQLTPDPRGGRVGRHVHVHQLAPTMGDEDQHVQYPERQRGHGQQVGSPQIVSMIAQQCPPVWLDGRLGPRQR